MKTIKINLDGITDATSKFNPGILNDELENYLIKECSSAHRKERISLEIKGLNKEEEQAQITKIITDHFENKVNKLKRIDKYDDYFRFILLLLGIILIIISEQFTSFLSELFLIAGWVVVWEMVYDILFTGMKRKKDLNLYKKLANCEIHFY